MTQPLRILLVAGESAGKQVLQAVARSGSHLVGLMTPDEEASDKNRALHDAAAQVGCAVWPARWVRDRGFANHLRAEGVDVLLNVHSLFVLRKEVLAAPRIGCFNMHPGPLPRYAGLNAVSWALYRGESQHAVTIHWMVPEIDAGPIAYMSSFTIEESDTALTLSIKCVKAGVPLMTRLLGAAADPRGIPTIAQDPSGRCYYGAKVPQGGRLDWSRSAKDVVNFVRACDYVPFSSPWGHPKATFRSRELAVVKATRTGIPCGTVPGTVGEVAAPTAMVAAGDEWVLVHRLLCDGAFVDAADVLEVGRRFDHHEEPAT